SGGRGSGALPNVGVTRTANARSTSLFITSPYGCRVGSEDQQVLEVLNIRFFQRSIIIYFTQFVKDMGS
ncbi:MAG: hypothetical protein AAB948_03860, partial [Patescibacteria group bacterium]